MSRIAQNTDAQVFRINITQMRHERFWHLLLLLFLVILLAGLVWHQKLERDEGYLSAGSWLVAQGRLPYHDFVFPQQPYFLFIYSLLMQLTGPSMLAARIFSAAIFLVLAAILFIFVSRYYHRHAAKWAVVFFCFNTMSLYWYPRARQYVICDLLLFSSFFLTSGLL